MPRPSFKARVATGWCQRPAWNPGGTAIGPEFAPGFGRSALAHIAHQIDARVARGMALAQHGLSFVTPNLRTTALSATGDHLVLQLAYGAKALGLSPADTAAWTALRTQLLSFARVLTPFKQLTPPRLAKGAGNDYLRPAKFGFGVRSLGKADFCELLRMLLINVADVLNGELQDDRLRCDAGVLAWPAIAQFTDIAAEPIGRGMRRTGCCPWVACGRDAIGGRRDGKICHYWWGHDPPQWPGGPADHRK